MTIPDVLAKCQAEPRYEEFVDYLTGLVASGSFSGLELIAAAAVAAARAGALESEFVRRFDAAPPPARGEGN